MYCDINLVSELNGLKQFRACIITSMKLSFKKIKSLINIQYARNSKKFLVGQKIKIMEVRRYKSVVRKILQNLWKVSKAILTEKCVALNTYFRRRKKTKT